MGEKGNVAASGILESVGEETAGFVAGAVGAGVSAAVGETVKEEIQKRRTDEKDEPTQS